MNNKSSTSILLVGALALIIGLVIGYAIKGTPEVQQTAGSSAGTTFNTQKISEVIFNPLTSTSTAVLNTDSYDRIITDSVVYCSGLGSSFNPYNGGALTNLILYGATTSTATASSTNTNFAVLQIVATTSPTFYAASTTATSLVSRIWASGSYFQFYTNATNTAACTPTIRYIGS